MSEPVTPGASSQEGTKSPAAHQLSHKDQNLSVKQIRSSAETLLVRRPPPLIKVWRT